MAQISSGTTRSTAPAIPAAASSGFLGFPEGGTSSPRAAPSPEALPPPAAAAAATPALALALALVLALAAVSGAAAPVAAPASEVVRLVVPDRDPDPVLDGAGVPTAVPDEVSGRDPAVSSLSPRAARPDGALPDDALPDDALPDGGAAGARLGPGSAPTDPSATALRTDDPSGEDRF
ncbi:hypothetical protein [Streptomyces sp. NPDC057199]|uniref:hypothetical protein n=1 Tax=Streptomyces sp. NPDC057199 TaxID=3346047 RepID=UPI0036407EDD